MGDVLAMVLAVMCAVVGLTFLAPALVGPAVMRRRMIREIRAHPPEDVPLDEIESVLAGAGHTIRDATRSMRAPLFVSAVCAFALAGLFLAVAAEADWLAWLCAPLALVSLVAMRRIWRALAAAGRRGASRQVAADGTYKDTGSGEAISTRRLDRS